MSTFQYGRIRYTERFPDLIPKLFAFSKHKPARNTASVLILCCNFIIIVVFRRYIELSPVNCYLWGSLVYLGNVSFPILASLFDTVFLGLFTKKKFFQIFINLVIHCIPNRQNITLTVLWLERFFFNVLMFFCSVSQTCCYVIYHRREEYLIRYPKTDKWVEKRGDSRVF